MAAETVNFGRNKLHDHLRVVREHAIAAARMLEFLPKEQGKASDIGVDLALDHAARKCEQALNMDGATPSPANE